MTVLASCTPAGGCLAVPVAPAGAADRDAGEITLTTSLGFPHKLPRLLRDHGHHTRAHGLATADGLVLAQGTARVSLGRIRHGSLPAEGAGRA
ncbi:hypothetical protein [Catenuloplanes japonicus]|uniref:hypothetical protein n=1 Tax=Catenuloplanes japonicus TaxID=33876 RepID=UPI0012FB36EE|nr:hypothetical protein [Catenuloplanes japonicus]